MLRFAYKLLDNSENFEKLVEYKLGKKKNMYSKDKYLLQFGKNGSLIQLINLLSE